jgi:hypothetical protein
MRNEFLKFDGKSKEAFNIAQLAALLARSQQFLIRLPFDANGADVLAYNPATLKTIPVQVKSRLGTHPKYVGKGLYMAFPTWEGTNRQRWFLLPHDTLVELQGPNNLGRTQGHPSVAMFRKLAPYSLGAIDLI